MNKAAAVRATLYALSCLPDYSLRISEPVVGDNEPNYHSYIRMVTCCGQNIPTWRGCGFEPHWRHWVVLKVDGIPNYEGGSICNEYPSITPSTNALGFNAI